MPTARVDDIRIYYEIHGEGVPLLLVGGLANDVADYTERSTIVADLARRYKVVVFDNRGVGRTDKPDIRYSIPMMSEDAAGLLAALGIGRANVLGVSMGGRIALDLALRHPELVERLVLVSTSARVVRTWRRSFILSVLKMLPLARDKYPQPYYAFARQLHASGSYDCTDRLPEIHVPTLILHGKDDRTAPYALAEEMHARIPDSRLVAFAGGHLFLFLHPRQFVDAVLAFLSSPRGAGPGPNP